MRPEGRGELDSLYFTYPTFDAPERRDHLTDRAAVVIVGGGPVGLTAALTLARCGVPSVLLEAKSTYNDGSRAICIARQSYHIFETLGVVAPFVDKALGWTTGRTFYRGRQILEFEMPDGPHEKYRPMYNLEQQYIEQFLHEAVRANPLIDMRWQSEVTGIGDEDGGVTLQVRDANGTYALPADWVLAADGARSAIRGMRGLRFSGQNYEGRYVIADVRMHHDYPTIRRALFDPACRPGGTVLIHRQPDDIWRIDYQLRDGESAEAATREDAVRASVAGVLSEIGHEGQWELEWWSVYSANTLALDDYRDGRIFFIGDSAHIVPIFGVRGLNNGLADAQNIGWKLARVIKRTAAETLLDSYSPERRGATLDVFANASKSTRFMTPPTRGWQVMRDAALSLALNHPFAGAFANPRQMTPYTYADSPITLADRDGFACGPTPGAVITNARLDDGFLSDRLGPGFTVLAFGALDEEERIATVDPDATIVTLDPQGETARAYDAEAGTVYLVRPDEHVAARWKRATGGDVAAVLAAILSGQGAGQ
ncbi:FAD-dependent monooxygenase [Oricola sp.]|uniref:FAD-dependent monooxygenase n=1 Tax=Oricola sp. TaxID=1979950 RepID=UPI0025D13221|nr:FAD-dependent monooxygenase [Oricola sp.]MCI5078393.1 FAD-dependent monooxygenase [Oricola sp.]